MPKSIGIDHIVIESSNIKELKKFFVNVLGLKSYKDYDDEIFLKCGKQLLAIFKSKSKQAKLNHIAFKVDNFKKMKSKFKKLGYKLDNGITLLNKPRKFLLKCNWRLHAF